jgi:hypothetical protein
MPEAKNGNPVQFLNLLLDYFADGARWIQGDLDDGRGRRCLVGAIYYLRCKHQIPSGAAESLLQEALPRGHRHLAFFNDRCADIAELRALIGNARTLAAATAEQGPTRATAAQLGRWRILVRLKRERAAGAAAVDERPIPAPYPRLPEPEHLAAKPVSVG